MLGERGVEVGSLSYPLDGRFTHCGLHLGTRKEMPKHPNTWASFVGMIRCGVIRVMIGCPIGLPFIEVGIPLSLSKRFNAPTCMFTVGHEGR